MAETSRRRSGEMLRSIFKILLPHPEGLPVKDVIKGAVDDLELTPFEASSYPNLPEVPRYQKMLRFVTIGSVKSDWLIKDKGVWRLTEAGRNAYGATTDPEAFMRESIAGYKRWRKEHPKEAKKAQDSNGQRVWVIRAGRGAEYVDSFEKLGLVSIGFGDLPSVTGKSKDEIARLVAAEYPDATKQTRAVYSGQLYRFVNELSEDDYVVTPTAGRKELLIGEIVGDYFWKESPDVGDHRHYRQVQWLTRIPNQRVRPESRAQLGSIATMFQPQDREYFLEFIAGLEDEDDSGSPLTQGYAELSRKLLVPVAFLQDVESLLRERKQIIFYGPPGTGKTFIARELAKHLAPTDDQREVIQFHPNYSYEDFVLGYRPVVTNQGLSYELQPGPLVRLADRARKSEKPHVLLIDEINRGNLPKILGELLYLLEYRDESVRLMYGNEYFSMPANLLIIGTMNTADRSIALVDAALRRRFHFIPLFPNEYPIDEVLEKWLLANKPEMVFVTDVVDRLNGLLRERFGRHLQVGHSYFLNQELNDEMLERIWDYDIIPFLEDQLFGQEKELENFTLDRLRELVQPYAQDDSAEGVGTTDSPPNED